MWFVFFFLWQRLITHPICSQYAWRAVRLVTELRAGPARETCHILFRRKHGEAGDLFAGGKAGANPPPTPTPAASPASPFPTSKGPITYHPANAFSPSTYFSVVCILIL